MARSATAILTVLFLASAADAGQTECVPKEILGSTGGIKTVVYGHSIYVLVSSYGSDDQDAWRIDMQDGSALRLPIPSFRPKYVVGMSADDAALYFTTDNGLWTAALHGGPARILVPHTFAWRFGLSASDGQHLYWISYGPQSDEIWRMRLGAGGSTADIERVVTSLPMRGSAGTFKIGNEAIFIRSDDVLYRVPKSGGAVTRLFDGPIGSYAVSDRGTLWFTTIKETPVTYRGNHYDVRLWRANPPLYEPQTVTSFSESSFPYLHTEIVVTTAGGAEHVYMRILGGYGSAVFPFWYVMATEESGASTVVVPIHSGGGSLLGVYERALYVVDGYTDAIQRWCEPARQRAVRH